MFSGPGPLGLIFQTFPAQPTQPTQQSSSTAGAATANTPPQRYRHVVASVGTLQAGHRIVGASEVRSWDSVIRINNLIDLSEVNEEQFQRIITNFTSPKIIFLRRTMQRNILPQAVVTQPVLPRSTVFAPSSATGAPATIDLNAPSQASYWNAKHAQAVAAGGSSFTSKLYNTSTFPALSATTTAGVPIVSRPVMTQPPQPVPSPAPTTASTGTQLRTWPKTEGELLALQREDPEWQDVLHRLEKNGYTEVSYHNKYSAYHQPCKDGTQGALRLKEVGVTNSAVLIALPRDLLDTCFHLVHDDAGHPGKQKTYSSITSKYYRWGIRSYCDTHVSACPTCRARLATYHYPLPTTTATATPVAAVTSSVSKPLDPYKPPASTSPLPVRASLPVLSKPTAPTAPAQSKPTAPTAQVSSSAPPLTVVSAQPTAKKLPCSRVFTGPSRLSSTDGTYDCNFIGPGSLGLGIKCKSEERVNGGVRYRYVVSSFNPEDRVSSKALGPNDVQTGDRILSVNQTDTSLLTLDELVNYISKIPFPKCFRFSRGDMPVPVPQPVPAPKPTATKSAPAVILSPKPPVSSTAHKRPSPSPSTPPPPPPSLASFAFPSPVNGDGNGNSQSNSSSSNTNSAKKPKL